MALDEVGELLLKILFAENGYFLLQRALEGRYVDGDAHGYQRGCSFGHEEGYAEGWKDGYELGVTER